MTAHPGFGWPEFVFLLTGLRWTVGLTAIAFAGGGSTPAPLNAENDSVSHCSTMPKPRNSRSTPSK